MRGVWQNCRDQRLVKVHDRINTLHMVTLPFDFENRS